MEKPVYYSQFGEDAILSRIFPGHRGSCVEVGANDGIADSMTYFFEKRGWQCVLVEPNPELCRRIRATRSAVLHECAASSTSGTATLHVAEGAERAHGVSTLCEDEDSLERIEGYGFTTRPVQVRTRRLDDILEESKLEPGIEFISIDVEGHEYEVLQGLALERWRPKVLVIEDNSNRTDPRVRRYLASRGYLAFRRTGVNDWFAPRSERSLLSWTNRGRYALGLLKARAMSALRRRLHARR